MQVWIDSSSDRLTKLVEQIEYADKIGLDLFGIGEHHRKEWNVRIQVIFSNFQLNLILNKEISFAFRKNVTEYLPF